MSDPINEFGCATCGAALGEPCRHMPGGPFDPVHLRKPNVTPYDDKAAEDAAENMRSTIAAHRQRSGWALLDLDEIAECLDHLDSARAEIKRLGEEIERLKGECRVLSGSLSLQEMTSERLRKLCGEAAEAIGNAVMQSELTPMVERLRKAEGGG